MYSTFHKASNWRREAVDDMRMRKTPGHEVRHVSRPTTFTYSIRIGKDRPVVC